MMRATETAKGLGTAFLTETLCDSDHDFEFGAGLGWAGLGRGLRR